MEKNHSVRKMGVLNISLLIVLSIYVLALILLMIWGVFTSLKTRNDFYSNKVFWPKGSILTWGWDNFQFIWENFAVETTDQIGRRIRIDIYGQFVNTLLYAIGSALVTTSCACLVAYLVAKFDYAFSRFVYTLVLVVMVIPIIGSTPSALVFLKQTNLYDTWLGNYLMKFTFLGLYFLIFHGTFVGISPEYSEAATIDGASEWQIFVRIMIPLVSTTFYTVFLLQFVGYWNDYNTALIYMPTHPTLAYGVYYMSISNMNGLSSPPMRMASCVILALPLLIVFVSFRDKIMGNVTMGGVKE